MIPTLIPSKSRVAKTARKALAIITASSLVAQTMAPAFAQSLLIDSGAVNQGTITQAPNTVPVVNIARPNANGLSQNVYTDFNVGAQGLIFNNSTQIGQSQLGGVIFANPHLGGVPARVILNEVSSTNPSLLGGMMEVFGANAAVVVANPNGITCDGCGFINTARATLTTGTATIENGNLAGFAVTQGVVDIGLGGLDARTASYFDIVSRAAMLNGAIHGQDIGIYAGQNDFDYINRQIGAVRTSDGSPAPAVAIDSSALGGMYANRIRLESTEAGVGVNAPAGLVAGLGGMTLRADGRLVVGSGSSQGNIVAESRSGNVEIGGTLHAGNELSVLAGGGIELDEAILGALGDITLAGQSISLTDTAIVAGIGSDGILHAGAGAVSITAQDGFADDTESTIFAGSAIGIAAATVSTTGVIESAGSVSLTGSAVETSGMLRGGVLSLISDGAMKLGGTHVAATGFSALAVGSLTVDGLIRSAGGATLSGQQIDISADATLTAGGSMSLAASQNLVIGADALVAAGIDDNGNVGALGALTLIAGEMNVGAANLVAAQTLALESTGDVTLADATLAAGGRIGITGENITASAAMSSSTGVEIAGASVNTSGGIETLGDIVLTASNALGQSGTLRANGGIALTSDGNITQSGIVEAAQEIAVTAGGALHNSAGGRIVSGTDLIIDVASLLNAGALGAGRDLFLTSEGAIENRDLLAARRDIVIALDGTFTNTGTTFAARHFDIAGLTGAAAGGVVNENGIIEANEGNLSIVANAIINRSTSVEFETDYESDLWQNSVQGICQQTSGFGPWLCDQTITRIKTETWTDRRIGAVNAAQILSGGDMTLEGGAIVNEYSLIATLGNLSMTGTSLTNTARDLIDTQTVTTDVTYIRYECERFLGICINLYQVVTQDPSVVITSSQTMGTVHATIQAGGTLSGSFTDRIDNVTIRENGGQIGLSSGGGIAGPLPATVDLSIGAGSPSTGGPGIDLSALLTGGSLTQVSPDPLSSYLIETRPEFVDLSRFFNSDYFFSRMPGYQPDAWLRRLGDAYIETRLIQDQIFALTGRRLLEGFGADIEQIQALYDNALAMAEELNLSTGVALTAEQVAALTSDIIWQERMIVDGQEVFVPRVYLAASTRNGQGGAQIAGDNVLLASVNISSSGAIESSNTTTLVALAGLENLGGRITGETVAIDVGGTLANLSGTIAGQNVAIIAGDLINQTMVTRDEHDDGFADRAHQQAVISGTSTVDIDVAGDVLVVGGVITAGQDLTLAAGGDVSVIANQLESASAVTFAAGSSSAYSLTNQLAELEVGGNLSVTAGGDLSLIGAQVAAGEDATLLAQGEVIIAGVQDVGQTALDISYGSGGLFGMQAAQSEHARVETNVGSSVDALGDLAIISGGDTRITASSLAAGQNLAIDAGGEVDITGAEATSTFAASRQRSGFLYYEAGQQTATLRSYDGSFIIGGGDVAIRSGADVGVTGSTIVSAGDILLQGDNITIRAAQIEETETSSSAMSGLVLEFGNQSFFLGFRDRQNSSQETTVTSIASAISAGNDLTLSANTDIVSEGGFLGAGNDLTLEAGNDVQLSTAIDTWSASQSSRQSQFGISGGVQENISRNVETLLNLPENLTAGKGSGFNKAVTAASAALRAIDAANALLTGNLLSASLSLGFSTERMSGMQFVLIEQGTMLQAGNDIAISAGNEISARGAQIIADNDITLAAGRDITLEAAQNRAADSSQSSSASLGISVNAGIGLTGPNIGFGINASGQTGQGQNQSVAHTNTLVSAGNAVSLTSGGDTTLSGAVVEGESVTADIGGNLTIESLQDTSSQSSSSAGGSIGLSFGSGGLGVNLGVNGGVGQGTSAWVSEQSGIFAEDAIDITVAGNTHLQGGAIISESGNMVLETGTLTFSNIEDHDQSSNLQGSLGVSLGIGAGGPGQPSWTVEGSYGDQTVEQLTSATIGEGEIVITDAEAQAALEAAGETETIASINRDPDLAQQITFEAENYIGVYASDTSIAAAIEAVEIIGKSLSEAFGAVGNELIANGEMTAEELVRAEAIVAAIENGTLELRDLLMCSNPRVGFNFWHLFVSPAYASTGNCTIFDANGTQIAELSPAEREACIQLLAGIMGQYLVGGITGGGGSTEVPEWVNDLARQLREIASEENLVTYAQIMGLSTGLFREVIMYLTLGEEEYANYKIFTAQIAGIGVDAADEALETFLETHGIKGQDADDIRLLAAITVGGTAAFLGSKATLARPIGFTADTVSYAYSAMRGGGGHAIRHILTEGLIPNSGSLATRVRIFENLTSPILLNPTATFDWILQGGVSTRAFAGQVSGRTIVIFVAKEGRYQGQIMSAVIPDQMQMSNWGL